MNSRKAADTSPGFTGEQHEIWQSTPVQLVQDVQDDPKLERVARVTRLAQGSIRKITFQSDQKMNTATQPLTGNFCDFRKRIGPVPQAVRIANECVAIRDGKSHAEWIRAFEIAFNVLLNATQRRN